MPIEYEFETVDCPIRIYASKQEYSDEDGWALEIIIQPESGIEQFDEQIIGYISDAVEEQYETSLSLPEAPVLTKYHDPPHLEVFVTVRNGEYDVVEIGTEIGEAITIAEQRVTESVYVDNGDFNVGMASVLYDDD